MPPLSPGRRLAPLLLALAAALPAAAAERVTLRSGFAVDCLRHETSGDRTRLILPGAGPAANYMEVSSSSIVAVETTPDAPAPAAAPVTSTRPIVTDLRPLLASIVRAESNGAVRAVSRTGAQGLMQLMPRTASELGVHDSFAPDQNINGGTAYLDQLLTRYHDNIALAVAAYNAGPAAVDRFHGVPPFRETRAYVSRVIREFNRRKLLNAPNPATLATTLR